MLTIIKQLSMNFHWMIIYKKLFHTKNPIEHHVMKKVNVQVTLTIKDSDINGNRGNSTI